MYNIDIQIVSSLGVGGQHAFSPSDTDIVIDIAKGHTHGSRTNEMESELQNEVDNGIANDGDKLMEVLFVSVVDIHLFATKGDDECHIGNLPSEVPEKILEIEFASSAILAAGNACHIYQTLCKVNTRFRALVQRLKQFLPRLDVSGELKSCLIGVRSLLKKYGSLNGLLIELKES